LIRAASVLVVPGSLPVSIRRGVHQLRKVSGTIPTRGPIRLTRVHRQLWILGHRLGHQSHRTLTQLLRVLPRGGH
jgi:hypothetical protein